MTLDQAEAALKKVHLVLGSTKKVYDEKVREGRVVGPTNRTADDALKRGTEVILAVSRGPRPIKVEDYRGRPFRDAKAGLEKAGFKVSATEVFSTEVDKGDVVTQDPHEGTQVKGDTITLTVSKGPEMLDVPDMVGHTRSYATKKLKAAGFKVQALGAGNFTVRAQNPSAGQKAAKGSTVTITFVGF
jgi:serine/threonine-protein kinase